MHAGNSIVFMDLGKSDAQHIVEISKNLATSDQQEISNYISRLIEHSEHRSTIKCIFEESHVDALLHILLRFSDRDELVNHVQNSVQ
jgi:hypothetical protein